MKLKTLMCLILALTLSVTCQGQGYNHQWLTGNYYFFQDPKGRISFDSVSITLASEYRKMSFLDTQANLCDANGNFLMSSNGIWIANANNDTMMNGSGINPGGFTPNWLYGLVIPYGNVFLPYPADADKYVLFHHTGYQSVYAPALELFYSVIDITLDNGLGEVISKNNVAFQDTLGWGIGVCRHANGRDWWIVMMKDSSNAVYKVLLTPNGIDTVQIQSLNYFPLPIANIAQLTFSRDGSKFISTTYDDPVNRNSSIIICDFDRCSGTFSNTQMLQLVNNDYLWGLAFSPSGQYAYACSNGYLFQVDVNSLAFDTIAIFDGFLSPGPNCCYTSFFTMYLAANGKIYITSGSSVQHLSVINYPDSAGAACDVQQHAIDLVNYPNIGVPNHPNYYLSCDTTLGCPCLSNVGIIELGEHDFNYRLSPNPVINNYLHIGYQMPQNKPGTFQVYDITGKIVFNYHLPQWSNEQSLTLPPLNEGLYMGVITSNNYRVSKKFAVLK